MDSEREKDAARLISESIRNEWRPKLRLIIRSYAQMRGTTWEEACDAVELGIVAQSELLKIETGAETTSDGRPSGTELASQAMLEVIAEIRKQGA